MSEFDETMQDETPEEKERRDAIVDGSAVVTSLCGQIFAGPADAIMGLLLAVCSLGQCHIQEGKTIEQALDGMHQSLNMAWQILLDANEEADKKGNEDE